MISSSNRRGYVLIVTCLALMVVAGIAAMAVDAGRMYIARNEVQTFADAAALAATLQLDGTSQGIERAKAAVASISTGDNAIRWDMGTKAVSDTTLMFAQAESAAWGTPDAATWSGNPAEPGPYRFARVTARVHVPVTFLRMFVRMRASGSRDAWAITGAAAAGCVARSTGDGCGARLVE